MRAEALYNATVGQQSPPHMLSNNNNSSQPLHHHHHSSVLASGLRRSNPSFNASHPSTNPFPAATVSVLADSSDSGPASARPSLKHPRSTTAAESQLLSSTPTQSNAAVRDEQEQQQHQQHSQAQSQVQQLTGLSPSLLRSGPNADALLAATDGLTAEQLAGVIARLSQKLQKKERSDRYIENHLLLHFLQHLRRQKEALLRSLCAKLEVLSADIRVTEAQCALQQQRGAHLPRTLSPSGVGDNHAIPRDVTIDPAREDHSLSGKRQRVIDNFSVLEDHYFSTVGQQAGDSRKKALKYFTDDVFKLTQYSRLRHCATLMHVARVPDAPGGDVFRASNIVSSMEFDRDSEFLATAGVSRKIKIFEFSNVVRNLTDVHYPIREIPTQDKLSWVCWNPYIRHHLLSSDYEGLVKIWDVNLATALSEYEEHECRAWSVDYCPTKPAYFASGSDDGTVKIWMTTQRNSVMTIDNERANVCSVKFHPSASELLAFGSVDHSVKYYDLRNPSHPLQTFKSHSRAVSYVKFMSNDELVSASVDSTVKMWNLRDMSLTRTFKGHANNKNFVGLSVTPDYIACGSEENSVFCYYKAVPPPLTSFRFSTIDPLTGDETTEEDEMQFVSSVCWCPSDPTLLVAANSLGAMKVLKLQPEEEDEDTEAAKDKRNSNADREDLVGH